MLILSPQHRCVSIFLDKKTSLPTGFALGSIEGRVAIQYVNTTNPKDNFTFKCHRSNGTSNNVQDIYAVSCCPLDAALSEESSLWFFSFFSDIKL